LDNIINLPYSQLKGSVSITFNKMSGHENDKLFNDYQNCVAKMSIEEAFAALKVS
jgi:hypothetical protein